LVTRERNREFIHEATLILVDSPALLKDLRTTYALPAKKVMYLPNGADLAFFWLLGS